MSDGRSTEPQPQPVTARLGSSPGKSGTPRVTLALTAVLGLLLAVALSRLHLVAAARLAPFFGSWPGSLVSPQQLGKLTALGGLAALAAGILLLLLHLPHGQGDRLLIDRFSRLLTGGGAAYLVLDTAPLLGLVTAAPLVWLVVLAEELVQWSVLTALGWLVLQPWLDLAAERLGLARLPCPGAAHGGLPGVRAALVDGNAG